jgi:hypothetical protein
MRRTVGGILAVPAALVMVVTPPASALTSVARARHGAPQPFAVTSIWNTPIGRDAQYAPAGLRTAAVGVALVTVAGTTATDPVTPVLSPDCTVGGRPRRLPASLALPTVRSPQTLAVVATDSRTVDTWTSATRCGSSLGGRYAGRTRLDGDGIPLGGSVPGLPGIGGALRGLELTGSVPVRHALALLVPARYLDGAPRWPAVRADGTQSPVTSGSTVRLGALLALPPADAARLPVRTSVGRRLVTALRDQGAYVAGISDGDTVQLRADLEAVTGYGATVGHPFASDGALRRELRAAVAALAVVVDNAPGTVGGAGTRRVPPLKAPRSGIASRGSSPGPSPGASSALPASSPTLPSGAGAGSSGAPSPSAHLDRPDPAPPAVVAVIGALAVALLVVGLRAGRGLTRLLS